MLKKKICLLGAVGVGKTSLVARFVKSIFSERYLATVGVKMDKKTIQAADGRELELMIWDVAGDTAGKLAQSPWLRGAAGFLVVVDGTRPATLDDARLILSEAEAIHGPVPAVIALNKHDLAGEWQLDEDARKNPVPGGSSTFLTSALTGEGVETAFQALAARMLAVPPEGR